MYKYIYICIIYMYYIYIYIYIYIHIIYIYIYIYAYVNIYKFALEKEIGKLVILTRNGFQQEKDKVEKLNLKL